MGASFANNSHTISPRDVLNVAVYFLLGSIAIWGGLEYCFGIQIPVYPGALAACCETPLSPNSFASRKHPRASDVTYSGCYVFRLKRCGQDRHYMVRSVLKEMQRQSLVEMGSLW